MSPLRTLTAPIREFFLLDRAEKAIRAYTPAQHSRVREYFDAGERRLRAARHIPQAIPAAALLREAVERYLTSIEAARDPDADDGALASRDLASSMPELRADPARADASPSDDARVRAALAARDTLYFDRLSSEDVEWSRRALERAASMLRRRVEPRSIAYVRGARWGRLATIAVVVIYVTYALLRSALTPVDVARGKPVFPSSRWPSTPDGRELVDGEIGTSFGVHTNIEDSPTVVIDLGDTYSVDAVKVYNRVDGWFDEGLPLVVEFSTDGTVYNVIARREEHFGTDPPWIIQGHRADARFVRVRGLQRGYIALSEVEVFGTKVAHGP
jgi:hypothetical protein